VKMGKRTVTLGAVLALAPAVVLPGAVLACGFHSSFLAKNVTPKQWWEYHKHEYVSEEKPTQVVSGGSELEPAFFKGKRKKPTEAVRTRQKALIAMVLKHLMYLNATNVMPAEFPNFKKSSLPDFMKSFKGILVELGPDAVPFILDAYLATLLTTRPMAQGLSRNDKFKDEMVDVLMRIGRRSAAPMAAYASKSTGKRSRDAVLDLLDRVLQADPELRAVPGMVRRALASWASEGPKFLGLVRKDTLPVQARSLVLHIWLGISDARRERQRIFEILGDKEFPYFLRGDVVDFLAEKEVEEAVPRFLAILLDTEDNLYVRRCAVVGLWTIHMLLSEADMKPVTGDLGLKTLITSPGEAKALRIIAIFLLANLEDRTLLDPLVQLLNRKEEDAGVRMAAVEGLERLKMLEHASGRLDKEVLFERANILAYRFKLLEIVCASNNKENGKHLVKIVLGKTESVPMRVRALIALKTLNFPGFDKAAGVIVEKSNLVERTRAFVLDGKEADSLRLGVIRDLEILVSRGVAGPVRALCTKEMMDGALSETVRSPEVQEALFRFYLGLRGEESVPLLEKVLRDDEARPALRALVASWAGERRIEALVPALRKVGAQGEEPFLRIRALDALQKLGEQVSPQAVGFLLFPKSKKKPEKETLDIGLNLLARMESRNAVGLVARCVHPPHEGDWEISELALGVLEAKGVEAREWFALLWEAYRKIELGDEPVRTAFLECFLSLGPSRAICDDLLKRMRWEYQRIPLAPPGGVRQPGTQTPGELRQIIPALHGTLLFNAFVEGSAAMPDLGQAWGLMNKITAWYMTNKGALPKK